MYFIHTHRIEIKKKGSLKKYTVSTHFILIFISEDKILVATRLLKDKCWSLKNREFPQTMRFK